MAIIFPGLRFAARRRGEKNLSGTVGRARCR